jgi:hypothetical protein
MARCGAQNLARAHVLRHNRIMVNRNTEDREFSRTATSRTGWSESTRDRLDLEREEREPSAYASDPEEFYANVPCTD